MLIFITKCDNFLLQSVTGAFITKRDKNYYKVRQFLNLLQSVTIFITKCESFWKLLQSATLLQSETLQRHHYENTLDIPACIAAINH